MEVPLITRQYGFNYSTDFIYEQVVNELEEVNIENEIIYEQVVNELEEVNIENEIIYRSLPGLTKSKSEEYNKKNLKVIRSYSY